MGDRLQRLAHGTVYGLHHRCLLKKSRRLGTRMRIAPNSIDFTGIRLRAHIRQYKRLAVFTTIEPLYNFLSTCLYIVSIVETAVGEFAMLCPKCNQLMEKKRIGDVLIDECLKCRGIWFDMGEIDDVKDEMAPELRWMDFELWRAQADFKVEFDPLFCPRCKNAALTAVTEKRSATVVRFCTQCGGTWLNAGDLANVIDALNTELDKRTATDHFKESLRQAAELVTGEKDRISEWKDLKAVLRLLKYRIFVENPKLSAVMQGLQKTLPL
jgi:Zn-finger nucleic acid-binding protein